MAKQLNVNLAFTADTGKAKTQIQELQNSLTNLMNSTATGKMLNTSGMTESIAKASQAAAQLKVQLESATNVNTGKLDLTKFMSQLKSSGMTLEQYKTQLTALGPQGSQTFAQLARAITTAEVPLMRANSKLKEFGTTLMNTARWQISSSILHGFMGSVQQAYHYAQNLNQSLNNIRIVTGQGVDEMARFAEEANKSARALSTTTTSYTNAALIYYQQGLNDQEVKERTDVTIKMANVARESAETVSTQMTAVWNNFDDGSKSLEYYADVMTALGAATASSTAEISDGLQKFASVAETVGLSYEYATSALATITATTRESASVVGTALKTLFARIQGLQLGETLEDGVDLNKYSEALDKIGVSIFEANGEMKAMDDILDETAAKWDTLAEAEQMALAQTVAGVRQYTQFMALMENWDFMEQNLDVAYGSEGTLNEQAEIYAESWEAASKRVKASAENLYSSLLDDKFFININNLFADMLTGIGEVIKGMGGFKSVALMIGTVFASVFRDKIVGSINETINRFRSLTKSGQAAIQAQRQQAADLMKSPMSANQSSTSSYTNKAYEQQAVLQQTLINNAKNMSAEQQKIAAIMLDQQSALQNQIQLQAQKVQQAEAEAKTAEKQILNQMLSSEAAKGEDKSAISADFNKATKQYREASIALADLESRAQNVKKMMAEKVQFVDPKDSQALKNLSNEFGQLAAKINASGKAPKEFENSLRKLQSLLNSTEPDLKEIAIAIQEFQTQASSSGALDILEQNLRDLTAKFDEGEIEIQEYINKIIELSQHQKNLGDSTGNLVRYTDKVNDAMSQMVANQSWGQVFMTVGTTMTSLVTIMNAFKSAWQSLTNPDLSGMEKFMAVLTAIGMIIPTTTMMLNTHNTAALKVVGTYLLGGKAALKQAGGTTAAATASTADTVAKTGEKLAVDALSGGFKGLMASMGPVLVAMLAIVAVVAVLTLAIWGISKAIEAAKAKSPEGQLQAAKEKAEELATALDEAKNSAEELRSAFDEYSTVRDALDGCVKGTEEWNEALKANNDTVLELMKNFPELASMINDETGESAIYRGENGELVIANWAMEQMQGNADASVEALTTAGIQQNQVVRDEELVIQNNKVANVVEDAMYDYYANTGKDGTADTLLHDPNDSTYGPDYFAQLFAKNAEDFINLAEGDILEMLPEWLADQGVNNQNISSEAYAMMADAIFNSLPELKGLVEQKESDDTAADVENEAIVSDLLAEQFGNSRFYDDIVQAQGKAYDSYLAQQTRENKRILIEDEEKREEIAQEYANLMDIEVEDIDFDSKGNVRYQTRNDEGKLVWSDFYSAEDVAALTAVNEANKMVVDSANVLAQTLATAGDKLSGFVLALANGKDGIEQGIQGLLQDFTEQQIADMISDDYEVDEETGRVSNIDDDILTNFGLESEEQFNQLAETFGLTGEELIIALNDLATVISGKDGGEGGISTDTENYIESHGLDFSAMSVNKANAYENAARNAAQASGVSMANISRQNADNENLTEYYNALAEIDSTARGAGDQVRALNEQYQISGYAAESVANAYDATGTKIAIATAGYFTDMQNAVNEILGEDGLTYGSIIDQSAIDTLQQAGIQTENYFTQMADGTYRLTDAAAEFNSIASSITLGSMRAEAEYFESAMYEGLYRFNEGSNIDVTAEQMRDTSAEIQNDSFNWDVAQARAEWASGLSNDTLLSLGLTESDLEVIQRITESDSISVPIEDMQRMAEITNMIIAGEEAYNDALLSAEMTSYGVDPEQFYAIRDGMQAMGEAGDEAFAGIIENSELLNDTAMRCARLNTAVEDLSDNYDDYSEILDDVKNSTTEYDKNLALSGRTAQNFRKTLANLLNVSEDLIDADLIEAISPADLEAAAQGNEEAIGRIRESYIRLEAEANGVDFQGLMDEINSVEEGAALDLNTSPFLNSLIDAYVAAGMTATEINSRLSGLGIDLQLVGYYNDLNAAKAAAAECGGTIVDAMSISTTTEPVAATTSSVDQEIEYTTTYTADPISEDAMVMASGADEPTPKTETRLQWTKKVTPVVKNAPPTETTDVAYNVKARNGLGQEGESYAVVKPVRTAGNHVSPSSAGGSSGGSSGGGGGSSSNPAKRIAKTKRGDVAERYKTINDKLEKVTSQQEKVNNLMDGLYGNARIAQYQKYLTLLDEEIELLDAKRQKHTEYLDEDTRALQEAMKEARVNFTFDSDGIITNYEEEMTKLWKQLAEYEEKQAKMSTQEEQDDFAEQYIDPLQEIIDLISGAVDDYNSTLQEGAELQQEFLDALTEKYELEFDNLSTTLEEAFDAEDLDLELLEYYIDKLGESFYGGAEAVSAMMNQLNPLLGKLDAVQESMSGLDEIIAKAEADADKYGLTGEQRLSFIQKATVEYLTEQQSNLIDTIQEINDLDAEMMDTYENALDKMSEELEKYTEHFEYLVSLTEHYITLSELIGGDTNYDALMKAYDAQSMVLSNQINIDKARYDALLRQREMLDAQRAQYLAAGDDAAVKLIEEQLQDVTSQLFEVQDNIYSLVAEQAEATRAKVEAQINAQNLTLEKALTGGTSFEYMNTQMEHRVALQEEYLTTTNKIYETTKLMRTAQNAIDETTNSVAKQKLKNFMRETEQLQKQTKLSKYELDIQQAKYDLLLAEIALEEAQDAKSTVRLTRDAEGNFGYVYTADQNQIAEAQQKLEDAQNKLYNLSLEGANDYTQKYQETLEAMYEELAAVNEDFTLTEEERMARMEEIQAHYYEQLMQFSSLYQVALSTDTRVAADAWSTEFNSIMSSTDDYMSHLETYSDNVMGIWKDWGSTLSNLQAWLEEIDLEAIVAESADLSDQITQDGGVIDSLEAEMDAVNALVNEYAAMRKEILESIKEVEALMEIVNQMIQTAAGGDMESIREWAASLTGSNYGSSMAIDTSSNSMGRPADFTLSADLYEAILNSIDVNTATLMSAQMLGAIVPASEGQLEQNVYINASFPNANNQYEIEQALVNLANRATQYTNRLTK